MAPAKYTVTGEQDMIGIKLIEIDGSFSEAQQWIYTGRGANPYPRSYRHRARVHACLSASVTRSSGWSSW